MINRFMVALNIIFEELEFCFGLPNIVFIIFIRPFCYFIFYTFDSFTC